MAAKATEGCTPAAVDTLYNMRATEWSPCTEHVSSNDNLLIGTKIAKLRSRGLSREQMMKSAKVIRGSIATVVFTTVLMASPAQALLIDMTVSFGSLTGTAGVLAFDFNPGGGLTGNIVQLNPLTPSGDSTSTSGNITFDPGTGTWLFADTAFDELQVGFAPLPATVAFSFQTTGTAASPPAFPDVFALYVLNASGNASLVSTQHPDPNLTCGDALFLFELGTGANGLTLCTASAPEGDVPVLLELVAIGPNPSTSIPEPGTLPLLLGALAAIVARTRKTKRRQCWTGRRKWGLNAHGLD